MSTSTVDRRELRRRQTIDEVLDVALQVMAERGVAGLSLGEVARRMGMRTPSLYGYFSSKAAVYDALFARGYDHLHDVVAAADAAVASEPDLRRRLLAGAEAFLRWSLEHRVHAELMLWRPVPDYQPSATAYAASVRLLGITQRAFAQMREDGLIADGVDLDEALRAWTSITAGVFSQQAANAPNDGYDDGAFTAVLPRLVDMFAAAYGRGAPSRS